MRKNLILISVSISSCLVSQTATVNSAMFGTMETRQLGPGTMSGRITAIEGVIKDEGKTMYVGTAGGGVWKSTNAGASFNSMFDKYCQSIGAIAIDQQNPEVVYVGTGESNMRNTVSIGNGMYKSTDGGDNWKKIGLDSSEHISRVILHPKNSEIVYAAVPGALWSDSKHRGVFKSTNGGETWEKIFFIDNKTGCAELLMDPTNPEILFASMWQFRRQPFAFNSGGKTSGLFKSSDGGKTWKEITNGLPPKPFGRIAMNLAPSDPKNMIAIVESEKTGLYISSDGGESWKNQSATLNTCARPFYFSTIAFDPKDPKRVYRPGFQFSYSDDGGYSFQEASSQGGWVHSDMHALWINPVYPNIMYVGTDGGVYMSADKGATWRFTHCLPVGQFYHVAFDNQTPYNVYGGLQDNGSWYAPSAAPGGIGNANWAMLFWGDGFWTVPDADGKTVYAEYQGGHMYRIDRFTMKNELIQPQKTIQEEKLRWNWNTPIVIGAANPKNLYVGSQYLYRSKDQGRNWMRISPDLTTNDKNKQKQEDSGGLSEDNTSAENHCTIFNIAESPLDEMLIWAGTDDGNLQVTNDGGKTWTNVSANVAKCGVAKQAWVSSIEPSGFDKNTVYATFDNHMYGDHHTYLAKSTDLGRTWKRIMHSEFSAYAHKITEDPVNKDLLFLGTENGLFATLDGCEHWFRMKNNIPDYAMVRDVRIHPKTHDVVIATHGRGIFILDDVRLIRDLNKEIREKDVHLFPVADITLNKGKFGWGGPQVSGDWHAWNPADHPTINYYLKKRLNSGKVTAEIYNEKGELVQSIPGTIRKGINKIRWNLRSTPPKVSAGSTKPDGAGFTAPMVMPGTYKLKLKVKDQVLTGDIRCVHDTANKDYDPESRKMVFEKSMELQKLYNKVNAAIDTISEYDKMLLSDSVAYRKNKNAVAFHNDLLKIKSEFVAFKKVSIFADEEKLREKVSKLYSSFCEMESKPNLTQLESINDLQKEYDTHFASLSKSLVANLPKVKELTVKKGLKN